MQKKYRQAIRDYSRNAYKLIKKEATSLAEATVELVGRDVLACGEMHEYYHPDTGDGVNNQGFQSWNLLVNNMVAYLDGHPVIREF